MMKIDLDPRRRLIDDALGSYLPKESVYPPVIHRAMRYSVFSGGKRIRPMLLLESARACGGGVSEALPAACAIELIHTYSLIHDDLPSMDDADTRRGIASCHRKFGEAVAVLAGDALLTLAFGLLAGIKRPAKIKRIITDTAHAIGSFGMIGGQVVDLEVQRRGKLDLPKAEYINLHKTASLIAVSVKAGAIIAGASQKVTKSLQAYGEYLGLAFQIVDDILDKDGYVEIFGINGAREEAARLVEGAKSKLQVLGKNANNLSYLADYVLRRRK